MTRVPSSTRVPTLTHTLGSDVKIPALTHIRSLNSRSNHLPTLNHLQTNKNTIDKSFAERMINGRKTLPEGGIQLPETKVAAETGTMSGPLVSVGPDRNFRRKADVIHLIIRLFCLLASVIALFFMATAKQAANISIYGFTLPVVSKWSFSDSFEYLVGVTAAVAVHSVLQLLISTSRLLRKCSALPSRNHAWLIFAGDQLFAYAMMSAGSAASGVSNLNRTGIRHSALPDFCKPLHNFCDRVALSIAFTFLGCFLLAISAILDVIWLSKY